MALNRTYTQAEIDALKKEEEMSRQRDKEEEEAFVLMFVNLSPNEQARMIFRLLKGKSGNTHIHRQRLI